MTIKTIIFDAGGIIFKSDWLSVKKDIMKKYNFSILLYSDYPKNISKKFRGINVGNFSFKDVIKYLSKQKSKKKISMIIKDYKKSYTNHQRVNKKLLKLIKKLGNKYNLFCLTNTNDVHLEINHKNGNFSYFKKVYASCELKIAKPDERIFKIILKDSKLKPENTVFIDNELENIKSAKRLRINTIFFKNNTQLIKDLKKFGIK